MNLSVQPNHLKKFFKECIESSSRAEKLDTTGENSKS